MKNKIVSFSLIFMLSFGFVSTIQEKKVDAVALTAVAGYSIAQILGSLALSATVVSVGYAVTDTLVNPDDNSKYTDFLKQVFKQTMDLHKYESPPPPKPLGTLEQATLLSMLTKQGIEVTKDLYDKAYDFFQSGDALNNIPSPTAIEGSVNLTLNTNWSTGLNVWASGTKDGKTDVWFLDSPTRTKLTQDVYLEGVLIGYLIQTIVPNVTQSTIRNNMKTAFVNVENKKWETSWYVSPILRFTSWIDGLISWTWNSSVMTGFRVDNPFISADVPDNVTPPESIVPSADVVDMPFKNVDMTPLNGLVSSPDELVGIINGDIPATPQKHQQINEAFNEIYESNLENPNFIGASAPVSPSINPATGTQVYGDPLLDNPLIESPIAPDTELSFWGKVLFWLKAIWQTLRDLPRNIYEFFKNVPSSVGDAWDTSIDVPLEKIDTSKLKLEGIIKAFPFSIPFDYIRIISQLNVSPIEPDLSIDLNTNYFKLNHVVDISFMNKYIVFFRWFILLTFILGLMLITNKVIKW